MPRGGAERVGLLGGTFNPPHIAHLVAAQEARWQLELDRVLLIPVHTPPHKEAEEDPGAGARLRLCQAAVAGDPGLEVSAVEVERGGPSYTVDTLRAIHSASAQSELVFILGADQAHGLRSWRDPEELVSLASLAVAAREGVGRSDLRERLAGLCPPERIAFFDMPRLDVSSTDVRRRVRTGHPIRHLVPDAVAEQIAADGLYRSDARPPLSQ